MAVGGERSELDFVDIDSLGGIRAGCLDNKNYDSMVKWGRKLVRAGKISHEFLGWLYKEYWEVI